MNGYLYEVSWEVCNKVGGIHTVIKSKLVEVNKNFTENYILFGPLLDSNNEFIEKEWSVYGAMIKEALQEQGIKFKMGYWDIEIPVKVLLINYKRKFDDFLDITY